MPPVRVQIQRLPGTRDLPPPTRMTPGAAGFDLHAAVDDDLVIEPGRIAMIPCGFRMALPPGYEAQVRPRSGLASKFGVTLPNSPGTIDADYRGDCFVPLINHGQEPFTVERGMRVAQMVIVPVPPVELFEVDALDGTARGGGGFGSTGH